VDTAVGKRTKIQITSNRSRFSKEEIEHIVADPIKYQKEL
jgi:hypothetical protein